MNDDCTDLENIKYKNLFLNNNNNNNDNDDNNDNNDNNNNTDNLATNNDIVINSTQITNIDKAKTIDDVMQIQQNNEPVIKTWSRLSKMERYTKLCEYVDKIAPEHELELKDISDLKKYLKQCLNRKLLTRMKDVVYDKKDGTIKKINGLQFKTGKMNDKERKFTLKLIERKDSTLKNLGSGKLKKSKLLQMVNVKQKRNKRKNVSNSPSKEDKE